MPSEDRPLQYHELLARLRRFGIEEKIGKGVLRKFVAIVEGRKQSFPLHVHSQKHESSRYYIRAIRDRFKIPVDKFYA